jgi:single-strand DNA-binding protein
MDLSAVARYALSGRLTMPGGLAAIGRRPSGFIHANTVGEKCGGIMNNLNSVLLEGNMVRDPLIRSTQKGTSVCNFTIASNRFYRQNSNLEKEVGFFDVETWGKLADACSSQGRKGRGVRVVGRLKQDRWTGVDGKSHNKVAIVAEHVEYRSDFKKSGDTASEALAEQAVQNEDDEISQEYPDTATNDAVAEEAQAVAF